MKAIHQACLPALLAGLMGITPATLPGTLSGQNPNTPNAPQPPTQAEKLEIAARARNAEAKGDFAKATEQFARLVKLEPDKAEWVVGQARCLGRQRLFNDALDVLEGAGSKFRKNPDLATLRARTYLYKAEYEMASGTAGRGTGFLLQDAATIAEGVLKEHPTHRDALLIAAQARFQTGDANAAGKWSAAAVAAHPEHPGGYVIQGQVAYQQFLVLTQQAASAAVNSEKAVQLETARGAFKKAVDLDPGRSFAMMRLGDLAAWNGQTADALRHYGDALSVNPATRLDHNWIQSSYSAKQRLELYGGAADRAGKREGIDQTQLAALEWYAGRAALDLGDDAKCLEWFSRVLGRTPTDAGARYYAFRSAFVTRETDRAVELALVGARKHIVPFADVVKALDATAQAQFISQVRTLASKNRSNLPICRDLNKLGAWISDDPAEWNNYAFLCRETGRYQESFDAYERALVVAPDDPQILNDAALILQYHLSTPKNREKAKGYYEKAIALAEQQLAAGGTSGQETTRLQTALRDARNNLKKLRRDRGDG